MASKRCRRLGRGLNVREGAKKIEIGLAKIRHKNVKKSRYYDFLGIFTSNKFNFGNPLYRETFRKLFSVKKWLKTPVKTALCSHSSLKCLDQDSKYGLVLSVNKYKNKILAHSSLKIVYIRT